ncbi:hypothetical protein TNCV_2967681 [Trichonephila clavipes]|nr:hypothetical protein TNCV_2967681 [Trichonephila clavipes]
MQHQGWPQLWSPSLESTLQQTSSNCSCRHLLSSKRPRFLTQGSRRGCATHLGYAGNMPVFAASDREPLRSSTVFRINTLNRSIPYSANSLWISTDASSNTVIR